MQWYVTLINNKQHGKAKMKFSSFNFQNRGFNLFCNFLLISLLINYSQEAVYTILTQLHSLDKKPKLCSWNTFLHAHQEYTEFLTNLISRSLAGRGRIVVTLMHN